VDSKPPDEGSEASLTSPRVVMGTTRYMSPEQVLGHELDHRTDIFSLGLVFYEMVTGHQAFAGGTATETMDRILHSEPEPIASLRANAPPELERIIWKCLEKDRDKRYGSARELHTDLSQLRRVLDLRGLRQASIPNDVRAKRLLTLSSAVGLLVILLSLAVWPLRRTGNGFPRSAANSTAFTVTQITWDPGLVEDSSLSPDGKWVVYVRDHFTQSKGNIYLQSVGGHTPINLTKDSASDNSQPAFSPDGERIVFRPEREGGGLFLMGRTGESVTRLTDTGYNPAWSPDGTEIVYAESQRRNQPVLPHTRT